MANGLGWPASARSFKIAACTSGVGSIAGNSFTAIGKVNLAIHKCDNSPPNHRLLSHYVTMRLWRIYVSVNLRSGKVIAKELRHRVQQVEKQIAPLLSPYIVCNKALVVMIEV